VNSPRDFYAEPGEPIRPKLRALAQFVLRTGRITTGAGIRRHEASDGTAIVADLRAEPFMGFFSCRVKDKKKIIVGTGFVNGGTVPTIDEQPIDGIVDGKQGTIPELTIDEGPDDNLRSWICVRATPSADPDADSAFAYDIAHTSEGLLLDGRNDDEMRGWTAIAMLVWSSADVIARVMRVNYFNLRHHYDAEAKRHVFS
jgi:hypothetical protein